MDKKKPVGRVAGAYERIMAEADASRGAALDDRVRFEALIADLSAEFVNLDSDLIDGAIQDAQRRIVEALDLDRSSLFQFSDAEGTFLFTHYWSRPGLPPPPDGTITAGAFPGLLARILKGELICFSRVDELPPDGPDLHAVLHDQRAGHRHRPRARDRAHHRSEGGRMDRRGERAGSGDHVRGPPAPGRAGDSGMIHRVKSHAE